jgi:hypothetical protein
MDCPPSRVHFKKEGRKIKTREENLLLVLDVGDNVIKEQLQNNRKSIEWRLPYCYASNCCTFYALLRLIFFHCSSVFYEIFFFSLNFMFAFSIIVFIPLYLWIIKVLTTADVFKFMNLTCEVSKIIVSVFKYFLSVNL